RRSRFRPAPLRARRKALALPCLSASLLCSHCCCSCCCCSCHQSAPSITQCSVLPVPASAGRPRACTTPGKTGRDGPRCLPPRGRCAQPRCWAGSCCTRRWRPAVVRCRSSCHFLLLGQLLFQQPMRSQDVLETAVAGSWAFVAWGAPQFVERVLQLADGFDVCLTVLHGLGLPASGAGGVARPVSRQPQPQRFSDAFVAVSHYGRPPPTCIPSRPRTHRLSSPRSFRSRAPAPR